MLRFIHFLTALSICLFLPLFNMQTYSETQSYLEDKIPPTNFRYSTYQYLLQLMTERQPKVLVETSTASDKDYCCGDGCSTLIFAEWAKDHGAFLYSVDGNKDVIQNTTLDLAENQSVVSLVQQNPVAFLEGFNHPIDFLYLDTDDFDTRNPLHSQQQLLKFIVAAYPRLGDRSIVVVDDCGDLTEGGTGKLAIDYLTQKDWKLIIYGHQAILVKQGGNPFAIPFQPKNNLDNEDYIEIQRQLRKIDLTPICNALYSKERGLSTCGDFHARIARGIRLVLIDPEVGFEPIKRLQKIGSGGDNCIVCYATHNGKYPDFVNSMIQGLNDQGFNGYIFYMIGGWPNPTGKEIQYAGVPYSFKIFMMLEAYNLGFKNVLWLDAAALPLRDPTPLFDYIDQQGALTINLWPENYRKYIFPTTHQLLKKLTGTDVITNTHINTFCFGIKMDTELSRKFVEQYYQLVELGTPFLSCFPEEFVIMAIMGQPEFSSWKLYPYKRMLGRAEYGKPDSQEMFDLRRSEGYFFYHRMH